jgi:hypothetical protein
MPERKRQQKVKGNELIRTRRENDIFIITFFFRKKESLMEHFKEERNISSLIIISHILQEQSEIKRFIYESNIKSLSAKIPP